MAEKEERIYVGKLTGNNYTCVIGGVCSGKKCGNCKFGMTHQEAIEKISERLKQFTEIPHVLADIALNALLEG